MMMNIQKLIDTFEMNILVEGSKDTVLEIVASIRCGMQLNGFYGHFHEKRLHIIGNAELALLESFSPDEYYQSITRLIDTQVPAIILTNDNVLREDVMAYAKKKKKWVLGTSMNTSEFITNLTLFLRNELADSISIHGELLNVFGMGVLIKGESGSGKSTAAIDLIRRGHLLVADDVVVIKKISSQLLVGVADEMTKNLIECRGVGIVNINSLFGKSAIRESSRIDLIINLTAYDEDDFNRDLGDVIPTEKLMGVEIPIINIPVKPGQFIPTSLIEVGALNIRQNQMGFNTAQELMKAMKTMLER